MQGHQNYIQKTLQGNSEVSTGSMNSEVSTGSMNSEVSTGWMNFLKKPLKL